MSNVRDLFASPGSTHLGYSMRREAISESFVIDGEARTITPPANFKHFGVESDEKSNRIWFEAPQIVGDNIDLATLNLRVNYKNANGEIDGYIVDDVEADGSNIRFSWSLSRKVTKYKGTVSFIVCAVKTSSGGKTENEWNTTLCTGSVLEGLEATSPEVEESASDLISQLVDMINTATNDVNNAKSEALSDIEDAKEEALSAIGKADTTPLANSLKATASGEVVRVDDVSPLEHTARVKVGGKNLLNADGMLNATFVKNGDGSFTFTKNGAARYTAFVNISIPKNTIVTLSATKLEGTADGFAFQVQNTDGSYTSLVSLSPSKAYASAKVTTEVSKIRLYLGGDELDGAYLNISGLQIELGNTATEYEPYVDPATVNVTRCGKNLLNPTITNKTTAGLDFTVDEEGKITVNGTATATTYTPIGSVNFKKGKTYILSGCPSGGGDSSYRLDLRNTGNSLYGNVFDYGASVKFTPEEDVTLIIALRYMNGAVISNVCFSPMVQLASHSESLNYEQYNASTYTPNADGTVDIVSVSPTMTLLTDTVGVTIDLEYNQDINVALDNVKKDIAEVDRMIVEMFGIYTPTRSYINILGGIDNWVVEEVEDNEGNVIGSRYGQVVNVNNAVITPNSKVDMQISSEQMVIFHEKDLAFVAENEGGVVTIYCIGNVPENDYTMQVTVTEVGTNE